MKKLYTLLFSFLAIGAANATVHNVEVGGVFQQITPYYSPQNLTISLGDTVLWTWASGEHNVTSNSGPASFASGDIQAPGTFQFVFTLAGVYNYDCTLFNHSDTQFGTITVQDPNGIPTAQAETVAVNPTLATDVIALNIPTAQLPANVQVYDLASGKLVKTQSITQKQTQMGVAELARGIYTVQITNALGESTTTKVVLY